MILKQKITVYVAQDRKGATNYYRSFTNIFDCANSHYSKDTIYYACTKSNKHPHQFRLNNQSLHKFAVRVDKESKNWNRIDSFEDLLARIKAIIDKIKEESKGKEKLGELVAYDCAARIAYLKYMRNECDCRPKNYVYLHAGVYKGAEWLFEHKYIATKPVCNTAIPIEEFGTEHFGPLFEALSLPEFAGFTKSMILESFMCVMMKDSPLRGQCR